jgi:hypothetical protein
MTLEVYTAGKPAIAHRTWVSACLLFLLVSSLAAWMTWNRSGRLLAERIHPAGWTISFQLPVQFRPIEREPGRLRFHAVGFFESPPELTIQKAMVIRGTTAVSVCDAVLRPHVSWLRGFLGPPATSSVELLGSRRALELHHPTVAMAVRAIVLDSGEAYAFALRVKDRPIDEPLYRLFDLLCRSVEYD